MAKKGRGKKKMEEEVIETTVEETENEVSEEVVQAVAEAIVEEAAEQETSVEEVVNDIVEESSEAESEEIVEPIIKEGIVGGCSKLNVRAEANLTADVVTVLDADTKVVVYPEFSNDEFYKIKTIDGLDGYCKTDFIWINEES